MHTSVQEFLALRQAATGPRHDIYALIHKGIRLMLGDILARAGRVSPDDPGAVADLVRRVDDVAALCEAHLAHEDTFIHPALEQARPGTSARIAAEHGEHARDLHTLRAHARTLRDGDPAQRAEACHALYHALSLFAAHNLVHMHIEETQHNAVLWAHFGDDEIAAIEGRLIAHLSPPELMSALRWMIPAISAAERLAMLGGMRANAPAPAFDAVLALAREVLDDDAWAALARGLSLPVAPGLTA